MVVGLGAILAAVFLALWKRKLAVALLALFVGLLVALMPRIFGGWVFEFFADEAVDRWEPVFVVAGLLLAAFILGRASFHWPEHGSTPDDAAAD